MTQKNKQMFAFPEHT